MTTQQDSPAELKTEAAELEQDIKEAQQEATQARKDGDDERAARLEASIADTRKELAEIKDMLKGFTERPFHPAPGDDEPQQQQQPADETKTDETKTDDDAVKPKPKRHWLFGDRWNQE